MALIIKNAGFEDLLTTGDYYLKALIIGENGAGKTPFAAQWPKPLVALTENGHMSLAKTGTAYADIGTSADMEALILKMKMEARKSVADRAFQTLVIDTIDSYQKKLIRERLRGQGNKVSLSGWEDWGWLDAKMQGLIEELSLLPMNVVVLMHTKDVEEEVEDVKKVTQRPRMKGDIKATVFDNFPLIGLVETFYAAGEGDQKGQRILKRQVRWQPDPKHPILRDQSTMLPRTTPVNFESSDYQVIFDAITGGLDDLPTVATLEELETEEDSGEAAGVDEVGALDKPALPRPKKAPAKKAAAKKAPAAKKAESEATEKATDEKEAAPESEAAGTDVETKSEDPWKPPADEEPDNHAPATQVAAAAKKKAESKAAAKGKPEAAQPEPEKSQPEPEKKAAPAPGGGPLTRVCGSQPKTFIGKHEPVEGCGSQIPPNATSASVAVVKFKTFLCQDCFDRATA